MKEKNISYKGYYKKYGTLNKSIVKILWKRNFKYIIDYKFTNKFNNQLFESLKIISQELIKNKQNKDDMKVVIVILELFPINF